MRISVFASDELAGAILLLKNMERDLAKQIRRSIKSVGQSEWQEAVRGHTTTALEVRVLADTARIAVSDQNVTLRSATIGRSLRGGAKPSEIVAQTEFGSGGNWSTFTSTSTRGKKFNVRRFGGTQFKLPNKRGYAVYPAAAGFIPRMAALFVQTTVRTFYERFEGGDS